jgi:hypothetical protein
LISEKQTHKSVTQTSFYRILFILILQQTSTFLCNRKNTTSQYITIMALNHFQSQVDEALKEVKKILDTTRNPVFPTDGAHSYDDKYLLAELAAKTTVSSFLNVLVSLGLKADQFEAIRNKVVQEKKTATLYFTSKETCEFLETTQREVEAPTSVTTTKTTTGAFSSKKTTKVTSKIIEHIWNYGHSCELSVYFGADASDKIVLMTDSANGNLTTRGNEKQEPNAPLPKVTPHSFSCNVTFVMQRATDLEKREVDFTIDRQADDCHTPRQNKQIIELVDANNEIRRFAMQVSRFIRNSIFRGQYANGRQQGDSKLDLSALDQANTCFSPILAMFSLEKQTDNDIYSTMEAVDAATFLKAHDDSMASKKKSLESIFSAPAPTEILNSFVAYLCVILAHMGSLADNSNSAVQAIENMLRKQLIDAIGKQITPTDFAECMEFHNRKLFKPEYRPKGFCYSVQRPNRFPEGILSIEKTSAELAAGSTPQPINTTVMHHTATEPMKFALNAAADVYFTGDRYLHACVLTKFSDSMQTNLRIAARAKQFSSFILMIGNIASKDTFQPTDAIIVQNKDDVLIPLLLETIPTPKEFRDAIESLSPEQQRFAKAFRSMQLASTLFGVCVIQIKPQLEKVLNLPDGSLTKQIELTQDLMDMFIKYQIPSDMMTYDGDDSESSAKKVETVKEYVKALQGMVEKAKEAELQEAAKEAAKATLEYAASVPQDLFTSGGAINARSRTSRAANSFGGGGEMMMMRRGGGPPPPPPPATMTMPKPAMAPQMTPQMVGGGEPSPQPQGQQQQQHLEQRQKQPKQQQQKPDTQQPRKQEGDVDIPDGHDAASRDYTLLPTLLDKRFEEYDEDSALRPTTIKLAGSWTRKAQAGLLSKPKTEIVAQRDEKSKAFDLIDALTRSGVLVVEDASLHIVLAATHCFDKALLDTITCDNVNPIEKAERSALIMASTIHGKPAAELVEPSQVERLSGFNPKLFLEN